MKTNKKDDNLVILYNNKDGIMSVELHDILDVIGKNDYHWSVLEIDFVGDIGERNYTSKQFMQDAVKRENGYFISMDKLRQYSKNMYQLYDCQIIACKDKKNPKEYDTEEEMYATCDIVLELFDFPFWEIRSKDKNLLKKIAKTFEKDNKDPRLEGGYIRGGAEPVPGFEYRYNKNND